MIEIFLKNREVIKVKNVDDLPKKNIDFYVMQFIDYTSSEILWASEQFGLDCSIINHYNDIEISSHFSAIQEQISFHLSMPYYDNDKNILEAPIFYIFSDTGLFFFSNSDIDDYFSKTYRHQFSQLQKLKDPIDFFRFQIELISDHYADITEAETKKIKSLANRILLKRDFNDEIMDVITRYNFNNLLIKESLIQTTRVFNMYKKSSWEQKINLRHVIDAELNDLSVISDYIQFNFDRLYELKENVANKLELEQNHIFKRLTVVTVCISLPTLIAGIYGMNFENMPGIKTSYGFSVTIVAMFFAVLISFLYFKKKRWL